MWLTLCLRYYRVCHAQRINAYKCLQKHRHTLCYIPLKRSSGGMPVHCRSERCALGCMQHDSRFYHTTNIPGLRDKEKALFSNIDANEAFRSRSRTGEGASTPCSRSVQFRMRVKFHDRILNEFDLPRRDPNDTFAPRSLNAAAGIRQRQSAPAMRVPSGHAGTRNPGTVLCTEV